MECQTSNTLKIAHVITGLNDGGAEAILFRLCTGDNRHDHVIISLLHEGKYGSLLRKAGIRVHCIKMKRGHILSLLRLWKILRQSRPDVVQTWMYHGDFFGGLVARLAGIHRVFWGIHHSNLQRENTKRSTLWIAKACALLSRSIPYRIICCASSAVDVHVKLGYMRNKFIVIPNGYDLESFKFSIRNRERLRKEWNIAEEVPLLGMVARFHPQKDHKNLLDALGKLKANGLRFYCLLVGNGISKKNEILVDWIKRQRLDDTIILAGQRNDIPAIMSALDIHVLSSLGEAFPNVIAEAMACGTPCITTDVGDAAFIVGDTGWVVPPCNSESFAYHLAKAMNLLQHQSSWKKRQTDCRLRIESHFSIHRMVTAYHEVWGQHS